MRQLHLAGDVGWLQPDILLRLLFRQDRMAISEVEGIELSTIANTVTGIMRRDFTLLDLIKAILSFATAFGKEYNEKFVARHGYHERHDQLRLSDRNEFPVLFQIHLAC